MLSLFGLIKTIVVVLFDNDRLYYMDILYGTLKGQNAAE
jgi:hypothetical protein